MQPGFLDPILDVPPAILGFPAGVVVLIFPLLWAVLGIRAARGARSSSRAALAVVVLTLPASIAIVLWGAIILAIQNQSG